jgi:hypothetical protein
MYIIKNKYTHSSMFVGEDGILKCHSSKWRRVFGSYERACEAHKQFTKGMNDSLTKSYEIIKLW